MTKSDTVEAQHLARPLEQVKPWNEAFTAPRLALIIAGFIFALYPEVVLGTHSFFDRDFGLFTYPVAWFARKSIWSGQAPLWNPLSNCGIPFLAQWNTTVCYPLSWVYLLFPLPWSLNYFCLGHLLIGGLGMYFLALRWQGDRLAASIAGLVYALNGLSFNCLMWTSNLAALAWVPWVVLWVERGWREGGRALLIAALVASLQMLAGAPEIIAMTWFIVGSLWLLRVAGRRIELWRSLCRLGGIGVIVCGVSAIQLAPFLELLSESSRKLSVENGGWSMPAWGLANFLVPLFRCEQSFVGTYFQVNQQWTSSYYLGIGTVALGWVAIWRSRKAEVWWLGGVALLGLLLALGENAGFYPVLTRIVKGLTIARYPIKFVALTAFAGPLLAAAAVAKGGLTDDSRKKSLGIATMSLLLCIAGVATCAYFWPTPSLRFSSLAINAAGRAAALVGIAALLMWQTRQPDRAKAQWIGFAVLFLFGLDAITHMPRQNPTAPNRAYGALELELGGAKPGADRVMVSPRMQALLAHTAFKDPLVSEVGNRRSLFEDSNLIDGVAKVNGFFSIYLREQSDIDALLYNPTNSPKGLLDFLGVKAISSPETYWKWAPRDSGLPLVTAGQRPILAGRELTLERIAKPGFEPEGEVYLPPEAAAQLTVWTNAHSKVACYVVKPREVSAEVASAEPAMVVAAQSYSKNWTAYVDGRPAPLWRANHAFQATQIPAGRHEVRFVYHDAAFEWGVVISIVTLLGCGLSWWVQRPCNEMVESESSPAAAPL